MKKSKKIERNEGGGRPAGLPREAVLTLDEREPLWAELLAVVHDEHAPHVELDVVGLLAGVKQIKGRSLGGKQDRLELQLALHCRQGGWVGGWVSE
jgi:hypothetical protein